MPFGDAFGGNVDEREARWLLSQGGKEFEQELVQRWQARSAAERRSLADHLFVDTEASEKFDLPKIELFDKKSVSNDADKPPVEEPLCSGPAEPVFEPSLIDFDAVLPNDHDLKTPIEPGTSGSAPPTEQVGFEIPWPARAMDLAHRNSANALHPFYTAWSRVLLPLLLDDDRK